MSINNSTRAVGHVTITSSLLSLKDSTNTRRVHGVEGKSQTYEKAEQKVYSANNKPQQENSKQFTNAAQEIYSSVSNSFNELVNLTHQRLNPIALAGLHLAPSSKFNNIDLKRHQNYFNQMMNFDTPSGSWVDVSA